MKNSIPSTFSFAFACMISSALLVAAPSATQPAEPWSKLPTNQWPQLVLTNQASFNEDRLLLGASSFLVRMPDGEVVVGTAKHLIKEPGGVDPPIPLADLDEALEDWRVSPRTKTDLAIKARGRAVTMNRERDHDWLLLHLVDRAAKLPATPLTPRTRPAEVGETVYLIGVPYSDTESAQNVYKGVVVSRPFKNYFKYEFSPPVHVAGFSGAPIVDANGLLLGHGVSRFELKQKDGLEIEFGGEDATLALSLWEHRNDPRATAPKSSLRIELPAGWVVETTKAKQVLQFARYPDLVAFFNLVAESKEDFEEELDLMGYAKLVKSHAAKYATLKNREETDLTKTAIKGRVTFEYEFTGDTSGIKFHFRTIMFESHGYFCKVSCWTTPTHWDAAQSKFEEVVGKMQ